MYAALDAGLVAILGGGLERARIARKEPR